MMFQDLTLAHVEAHVEAPVEMHEAHEAVSLNRQEGCQKNFGLWFMKEVYTLPSGQPLEILQTALRW